MSTDPDFYYRRGVGVYTLDFKPPPQVSHSDRRLWLTFGAVSQSARVFFDDTLMAVHHGGYTAFTVELPDRPGQLRVEADNRPDPDLIPSDLSDFYLYGGITRPVYLEQTGPVRITRLLIDIDTTPGRAQLNLRGDFDGPALPGMVLSVTLFAPDSDEPVFTTEFPIDDEYLQAGLPDVMNPALWSPDDPVRYRLSATLRSDNMIVDTYQTHIGFRWFDFPAGGPFYLNGERLLLKGTHRHDDWAGCASAVSYAHLRQELEQIREAGFNFIRLGHYPQDDAVLHLCDSLGLIVWEELPWCRGGLGGETFQNDARAMLREIIYQHYNHPGVIFWGLGNELDWESEHPDSSDEAVAVFLRELHDLSHSLDPRRLTALRRFEPGAAIVDVYAPSIWSGWYRGRYADYATVLRDAIERYPRLLHIEWGGDSHAGRHNDGPYIATEPPSELDHAEIPGTATSSAGFTRYSKDGDWSESYIIDLMAHHLAVQSRMPDLAGTAQWVFKDFGTPLRPNNPIPYVNQKGLVARDGTPKDAYYVFQAFQAGGPVVRIEASRWPERVSTGEGPERIRVITNCERVQLVIDGQAQGTQARDRSVPASVLVWLVELDPGTHTIEAHGERDGHIVVSHRVEQRLVIGNRGEVVGLAAHWEACADGVWLHVQLVDEAGRPVTTDERRLRAEVRAGGGLARYQGTVTGSDVLETANGRACFHLYADPGAVLSVEVRVAGLAEAFILNTSVTDIAAR